MVRASNIVYPLQSDRYPAAFTHDGMNQLLGFYLGSHPDHKGRMLSEIVQQDDDWLEQTHDFIQWLFPLNELSRASLHAPLVDARTRHAFLTDDLPKQHMRIALVRMLRFLGLRFDGKALTKGANWDERKQCWFTCHSHNSLRVTRILKSMAFLGLKDEAVNLQAGLEALCQTEPDCGVTDVSRRYWADAVK